jgi:hypothetical protein
MGYTLQNPQFEMQITAGLVNTNSALFTGSLNASADFKANPVIGSAAGGITGLAQGLVVVTFGTPLVIDCTNLAASGLDLQGGASSATFLVAFAAQVAAIGLSDSPTETLTIGGGTNPIIAANNAVLCKGEFTGFQKVASGGLALGSGAKNITLTASAGTIQVNLVLWTR